MDQIPLTAVGKVFKPALKWDAIKRVYEKGLSALGDMTQSVIVEAGEDKVHGTGVKITIQAAEGVDPGEIESKICDLLTQYTLHYEVSIFKN